MIHYSTSTYTMYLYESKKKRVQESVQSSNPEIGHTMFDGLSQELLFRSQNTFPENIEKTLSRRSVQIGCCTDRPPKQIRDNN